jgi:hypothetical protein
VSAPAPAAAPTVPSPARPVDASRPVLPRRLGLLLPAGLALLAGLDAALMLLGLPAPVTAARLPDVHGMLLVLGFVGTLIALERAVALGRRPGFLAPALLGAGAVTLVTPAPVQVGKALLVAGAAGLMAVYVPLWRRQRDDAVLVQSLGAVVAVGAATLWLGGLAVPLLLPWLVGFVVLTIAGERLELARIAMGPSAGATLLALTAALVTAIAASLLRPATTPALGLVLLALVAWLASHDAARHTVRANGVARFMALGMLGGYLWLAVAGAVWLVAGAVSGGAAYDAVVHAAFLGFTMSMVMAHAPVILPAVLRRPLAYHPALLVPLGLLHASLALRVWVGDAMGHPLAWQVGGVGNIVALLAFVATAAWSVSRAGRVGARR